MALNAGTKSQIRWLVGREHVGKEDREIAASMAKRCGKAKIEPRECKAIVKFAVQAHQENRGVYADVMGGRVGAKKRRIADGTWP